MGKPERNATEDHFQCRVKPLDDIQFDNDEEIKVPIEVELRRKGVEIPKKSHPGSACYDLKSLHTYRIHPKKQHVFDLGLALKMKKGWRLEIHNRSGLSTLQRIIIPGTPKIIDSDYRGNLYVYLRNESQKLYTVKKGDRIAQFAVVRTYPINFIKTRRIPIMTEQGTGGFGSSGR